MKKLLIAVDVQNFAEPEKVCESINVMFGADIYATPITLPTEGEIELVAFNESGVFDNHFIKGTNYIINKILNQ